MARPSRLGLALAATVAVSSLTFGGVAFAAPDPGTSACTDLVEADPAVANAAEGAKDAARTDAEGRLCTGEETPPPTEESTAPSQESASPSPGPAGPRGEQGERGEQGQAGQNGQNGQNGANGQNGRDGRDGRDGVASIVYVPVFLEGKPARDVDCDDFPNQPSAQAYYDAYPGDPARLDRDKDGKACESLADLNGARIAQVSDKDLDKTADDESEVEGDQVSEVPEGSVDTGGYDR